MGDPTPFDPTSSGFIASPSSYASSHDENWATRPVGWAIETGDIRAVVEPRVLAHQIFMGFIQALLLWSVGFLGSALFEVQAVHCRTLMLAAVANEGILALADPHESGRRDPREVRDDGPRPAAPAQVARDPGNRDLPRDLRRCCVVACRARPSRDRAAQLVAEESILKYLREAFGLTQAKMAKKLEVGQDTVSRVEKRADMLLSTLSGYVEAMGGKLELVAEFPDRPPVRRQMLELISARKASRARGRKAATRRRKAAAG